MATTTIDDYRMSVGLLLSCSRRQLLRIARRADADLKNRYTVYSGLTRRETEVAARYRRDDALHVLTLKKKSR